MYGYRISGRWLMLLALPGWWGAAPAVRAEPRLSELLLLGAGNRPEDLPATGAEFDARLTSIGPDGKLQFQTPAGALALSQTKLVRWSSPSDRSPAHCLVLTDGSRIVFSRPWDPRPMISMAAGAVTVHSAALGELALSLDRLRAMVLHGPAESGQYDRLLSRLWAWQGPGDRLSLMGGDWLVGRLIEIHRAEPMRSDAASPARSAHGESRLEELVVFDSEVGRVTVPLDRVAGLSFQPGHSGQPTPASLRLGAGLRDGSWLVCDRLTGSRENAGLGGLRLHLLAGLKLACGNGQEVVALQQLGSTASGSPLVYLSDLEPVRYQHQPYLDIPWPYRTDHNVWGGRLRVNGRVYPKGLGMHSSSRLTYRIPPGGGRLAAQVAIDDVTAGQGSVVFLVELLRGGQWREVYRSPVVRGGEPPRGVSVHLAAARQLALVTEYADRGDAWDDADWLDARLERGVDGRESDQEPGH